jgi:hypothetical protein
MSVRFNLDNQADRRAWDYLQSVSGSRNKAVIDALCLASGGSIQLCDIEQLFQKYLSGAANLPPQLPSISEEESALLDELDNFMGM